jgi:hypothetical protein
VLFHPLRAGGLDTVSAAFSSNGRGNTRGSVTQVVV